LENDPSYVEYLPDDPDFQSLRGDPEFENVVAAARKITATHGSGTPP
jgi:hypothetical protein